MLRGLDYTVHVTAYVEHLLVGNGHHMEISQFQDTQPNASMQKEGEDTLADSMVYILHSFKLNL